MERFNGENGKGRGAGMGGKWGGARDNGKGRRSERGGKWDCARDNGKGRRSERVGKWRGTGRMVRERERKG